jgi:hypothetical protein
MPASPPPTSTPSSRSTPSPLLAAIGCSLRPPAAPTPIAPPSSSSWTSSGDTLVVWKLDRLGRSLRHLVDTVTGLVDRGVGFRSLEAIDTTTPGGKLVFHVFAALAEFERDLIRERTAAGLAAARARGRRGGRPSVLTGYKLQVARRDVPLEAVHGGGDRHDPGGQPGLDLPASHRRHELTESSQRDSVERGSDYRLFVMKRGVMCC